jgi:hypothetical protein
MGFFAADDRLVKSRQMGAAGDLLILFLMAELWRIERGYLLETGHWPAEATGWWPANGHPSSIDHRRPFKSWDWRKSSKKNIWWPIFQNRLKSLINHFTHLLLTFLIWGPIGVMRLSIGIGIGMGIGGEAFGGGQKARDCRRMEYGERMEIGWELRRMKKFTE